MWAIIIFVQNLYRYSFLSQYLDKREYLPDFFVSGSYLSLGDVFDQIRAELSFEFDRQPHQ
jgi:hypothetical protein